MDDDKVKKSFWKEYFAIIWHFLTKKTSINYCLVYDEQTVLENLTYMR